MYESAAHMPEPMHSQPKLYNTTPLATMWGIKTWYPKRSQSGLLWHYNTGKHIQHSLEETWHYQWTNRIQISDKIGLQLLSFIPKLMQWLENSKFIMYMGPMGVMLHIWIEMNFLRFRMTAEHHFRGWILMVFITEKKSQIPTQHLYYKTILMKHLHLESWNTYFKYWTSLSL